ncbi:hypothetical protein [Candidatus Contendibacter odensensis]|uniref:Uncharacterized protein n=1 Tax=Candidatus Contendobacter odensis Run_B_J11 TaxID=1400861 RepID=A0A7U7GB18_9GAMM|nr:hypothetical protein [Candidatus Contendobacter odensis]MBK8750616.1 hypothetical protein [Candidatus Competibacteraceae bacterium]CDH45140.1 exported hypothetical protein [Candidatus Contendobacter odensis Run_B_J11]
MKINQLYKKSIVIAGILLVANSASGNESSLAEEIWSENFCEQAVSLAKQRGEAPEALNLVSCRLLNYYQPSYWQCVIAAMKSNSSIKLDAARQKCLAEY